MEFLQELFLTAFVALLLSFLIAKLVSMATSGDSVAESESNLGTDVDEETIMRELQFGKRLEVKAFESERKVEFIGEYVSEEEEFKAPPTHAEEIAESSVQSREIEAELRLLPEKSESEVMFDDVVDEASFGVEKGTRLDQESAGEVAVKAESPKADETVESAILSSEMGAEACQLQEKSESEVMFDDTIETMVEDIEVGKIVEKILEPEVKFDDIVEENVEHKEVGEIDEVLETRKDPELESDEINVVESKLGGEVTEVKLESDDDDDDWEGIERSELEKVFAVAAKYVEGRGELEGIGNDVQMEMHGLHKVATEGPCQEPQSMALKVNARAKWNAWQRMGNMSPEVAMERYVALLSDRIPGWMEDNSPGQGEDRQEPAKPGLEAAIAHDTSSFPDYQANSTEESNLELESTVTGGHVSGCSSFENQAKE